MTGYVGKQPEAKPRAYGWKDLDPELQMRALEDAGHDMTRIDVESPRSVTVHNNAEQVRRARARRGLS